MSQISKEIFDKIRTRFSNVTLGDEQGKTTLDSDQAVFIEFDYKNKGNVVVNLQDDSVKIYFNNDMISEMDSDQSDNWYAWLRNMRKYAHSNMLNFEVKNIDKQRLDRKDFEYLVKNSGEQEELTMESKMYGGKQKSYQDLNGARMIVKHARTVDEEKRGARSRNISAVYIENDQGERFKFPNTYLPAARAMTRHISNGGYPNDERGKHIIDIMGEMMDLRKFSRRTKRTEYTEEAREIIEDATARYYGLKDTLEGMKKQTGYESYFENWAPDQIEVDENDLEDLKIKLTREVFDDELSDTLSNVGKAVAMGKQKRMEDEERMGSEAQSLKQFAAGPDPIVLHPNPESDAEIQTYVQFIKNSNMPTEKRNIALVQRIVAELTNRMADDSLANAINRLDMDNRSDMATAFAIAKKYLTGKTEMIKPKAKKDRYGKDKVESWEQFESAIEKVTEGTWALPETEEDAMEIAAMMNAPIALGDGGNDAINALGGRIGDDELWDDLGAAGDKDPEGDARPIIIGWMMEHTDWENPKYGEAIKMALDKIKADGNDTMVIPRTFGNKREDIEEAACGCCGNDPCDCPDDCACKMNEASCGSNNKRKKMREADIELSPGISIKTDKPGIYKGTKTTSGVVGGKSGEAMQLANRVLDAIEEQDPSSSKEALALAKKFCDEMDCTGDAKKQVYKQLAKMGFGESVQEGRGEEPMSECCDAPLDNYHEDSNTGICSDCKEHSSAWNVDELDEGKMKDLAMHIEDMINDGASDEEIMAMHPSVSAADIKAMRKDTGDRPGEYDESLERMKAIAGIGSNAKSNHGIREGEAGYQITPRSIVAREMRKLQDLANK